ncbi:MAG: hypothetical protein ACI8WA_000394 [Polaribacter sp.]|jgi:hypothetical protein
MYFYEYNFGMRNYFIFLFLIFLSCKKNTAVQEPEIQKSDKNIVQKHNAALLLENISNKKVVNWKEYQQVSNNLKQFSAISANEALNNAIQLSEVVKFLKDSIRPKELLNLSFRTRINVLENEALRLKDMTFIPAITANEVNIQVDKIIAAFSATNSKINTIYSQLEVEKEILLQEKKVIKINTKKPFKKNTLLKTKRTI